MPKCTLHIELPAGGQTFTPGETIEAIVRVETSDAVECRGLALELGWRTHGKGNRDGATKWSTTLFEGTWEPGERTEYPCSIPVPSLSKRAPATYHGKYVNVDWFLRATADIPWAFDPDAEATVYVTEGGEPAPYEPPKVVTVEPVELTGGFVGGLIPAIVLILIGLFALSQNAWLGGIIVVPSVLLLVTSWRQRGLRDRVGRAEFGLWPATVVPGAEVHAFLALTPRAAVDIERISMSVTATEHATSGSGTDTTDYSHRCFDDTQELVGRTQLRADESLRFEGEFVLPTEAPTTFESADNSITWEVRLEIKPVGRRALEHREPLVVRGRHQR